MSGTVVQQVHEEKDLGVTIDDELKFSKHIAEKVKKANQAIGYIRNTFTCLDKDIFLPLYKSFVRPHLEYASIIWSPTFKKDIIAIEHVQRRATKLVTGCKTRTYEERLKHLGLPTLSYRRERTDMIQLFKIMNKYDIVEIRNLQLASNTNRGHQFKLTKSLARTRLGQNRFSHRVVNSWNKLSSNTVSATSLNMFKSHLNEDWKTKENKFAPI